MAIAAANWPTAISACARANLVLAGLPSSTQSDTQSAIMRQDLRAAVDLIKEARKAVSNNKRTIRVGARTLTGGPSRRTH